MPPAFPPFAFAFPSLPLPPAAAAALWCFFPVAVPLLAAAVEFVAAAVAFVAAAVAFPAAPALPPLPPLPPLPFFPFPVCVFVPLVAAAAAVEFEFAPAAAAPFFFSLAASRIHCQSVLLR